MTVGQKVVCIDGKFPPAAKVLYVALPVEGQTYVIRQVSIGEPAPAMTPALNNAML